MTLDRNMLYTILITACLAGYTWIFYNIASDLPEKKPIEVCLVKHTIGIPCPSCGSTRAIISLLKGDFIKAFYLNPFGYLIALVMLIVPIWILLDTMIKKNSLFNSYQRTESYLRSPKYATTLILLIIINWIWNITKGV